MPHKAFVDSSNRRKSTPHAHLRSETFPTLGETSTTHTRPLAGVFARTHSEPATKAIAFPTSPHCDLIPWPESPDADPGSGCSAQDPEPRRRTRARTGHVLTPRTTQPTPKRTPIAPKPKIPSTPKPKVPKRRTRTSKRSGSAAIARIADLVECSIAHNLRMRAAAPAPLNADELFGDRHELFEQDELLMARLGATLTLRTPVPPPRAVTISPCPPSVLSASTDSGEMPPPSTIPTKSSDCIRFIRPSTTAGRRGSVSSHMLNIIGGPLSLPALVATLILRRNNERESATRQAVQPRSRAPTSTSCAARTSSPCAAGTSSPADIPATISSSTSRWPRKYRHECHKPSPLVQITSASLLLEAYVVL